MYSESPIGNGASTYISFYIIYIYITIYIIILFGVTHLERRLYRFITLSYTYIYHNMCASFFASPVGKSASTCILYMNIQIYSIYEYTDI